MLADGPGPADGASRRRTRTSERRLPRGATPLAGDPTIELGPDQLPRSKRRRAARVPGAPGAEAVRSLLGPEADLAGKTLGDFRMLRALGSGASGAVYLAEQISLRRPVALKVLWRARAARPEFLARFMREAHAVARLVHPNAVQVYCVGRAEGHHFIALEYVDGQSLAEMLALRGRIPWRAALEIARQAAQSLVRAHQLGIVHRDLKPENILINRHAEVKVADFGLARLEGEAAITEHGGVLGTPLYMSPEAARGSEVGPSSDLYSLGCTLYHMLTGAPPFPEEAAVVALRRHVLEPPRPPLALVPNLPPGVSDLALRLLAKSPAERPASARMLVIAISRVRRAAEVGGSASDGRAPCGPRPDLFARVREVALSREGMRELLAMEATCRCLIPRPRRAFLEATMRNYRIPPEEMMPLLERPRFTRGDVWDLQVLKRSAQGRSESLAAIARLRELEAELGRGLLQACSQARGTSPQA